MKIPKLTQQAMVVAFAACIPVLTSLYKVRMLDAVVLILSGVMAVYNVNCLSRGKCNAWATLVAISFFVTTMFQLRNQEGAEPSTDNQEGAIPPAADNQEPKAPATWPEYKNRYYTSDGESRLPNKAQLIDARSKYGGTNNNLDIKQSIDLVISFVDMFKESGLGEGTVLAPGTTGTTIYESILNFDVDENGDGPITKLAKAVAEILANVQNRRTNIFDIARNLAVDVVTAIDIMCKLFGEDVFLIIIDNVLSITHWAAFITDMIGILGDLIQNNFDCAKETVDDATYKFNVARCTDPKELTDEEYKEFKCVCLDPTKTQWDRIKEGCDEPITKEPNETEETE
jgi:hypothetical protein